MAVKTYIIDTNIFLSDPRAIFHFENNNVVIPFSVIEEIDNFKKDITDLGRNARHFCRLMDGLRKKGDLSKGITLDSGGTVAVHYDEKYNSGRHRKEGGYADKQILAIAQKMKNKEGQCIVLTKDVNLRIRADVMGVDAEDYETNKADMGIVCERHIEIKLPNPEFKRFLNEGSFKLKDKKLGSNTYLIVKNEKGEEFSIARANYHNVITPLIPWPKSFKKISPKNTEQEMAMDALLDDKIELVTMIGKAGTGKTMLSVLAGVHKVIVEKKFEKLIVSKPVMPVGKDMGFLPGDIGEKMEPWVQPVFDALDFVGSNLMAPKDKKSKGSNGNRGLSLDNFVDIEPLAYMRGRNFHNRYIIIDEAQNLSPAEVKTILTRVGSGSKIVLTGDLYQIDNPYVDMSSNGLAIVINRLKKNPMCAHINLCEGVRSKLAELVANRL